MTLLRPILLRLIGLLVFVEVLRMVVGILVNRASIPASLIRLTFRTGVLLAVFYALPAIATGLLEQATTMGLLAGGNTITRAQFLDPGAWGDLGFQAGKVLLGAIANASYAAIFSLGLLYLGAWVILVGAYLYMGLSLFVLQIQFSLALIGAQVLLPFAATRWTSWLAQGAVSYPINVAFRFFIKALFAAVAFTLLRQQAQAPSIPVADMANIQPAVMFAIIPLVFAVLFWKSDAIAAGLLAGQPALTAGTVVQAAIGGAIVGAGALTLGGTAALHLTSGATSLAVRGIGAASTAYQLGAATTVGGRLAQVGGGLAGVARLGAGALTSSGRSLTAPMVSQMRLSMQAGRQAGFLHTGGTVPPDLAVQAGRTTGRPWTQQLRSTLQSTAYYFGNDHAHGGVQPPL